jgi:ABC-type transport system involved in multi-copper enzyme maturation permease subunit
MMGAFAALAYNGFREARRNRVSVVVAVFTLGLLLASSLVTEVTVYTFKRVLTDVGLGAMTLTLVLLAVFLSSGLISREIERRTIFLIVSKPVSRSLFLVARLTGNMLTLLALLLAMAAVFFFQVGVYGGLSAYALKVSMPQGVAVGMLWVELLVISSVGFLMSSFSSQVVSAVVTTGVYLAGHLSGDIYSLASRSESVPLQYLGKTIYYLLPNLARLNYRPQASYDVATPAGDILWDIVYGFGYSGILVALAVLIFMRRDFK